MMQAIISQEELDRRLLLHDTLVIDCRFTLGQPERGRELYEQDHIAGAYYLDLEKDLSGEVKIHGGRHPLPDLGEFALRLGQLGVHSSKWVIAYDDQGGAMASRLWWLLRFLGHTQVQVLDQGYQAWKSAGRRISREIPEFNPQLFSPRVMRQMLASIDEVKSKMNQSKVLLVDSRDPQRFLGIEEPIDRVAGHIPNAQNLYWKDILHTNGTWKQATELQEHFQSLQAADEIIVYCGSGVTACPNVLAMYQAGLTQVKLYAGSWSDWISYPDNPICQG